MRRSLASALALCTVAVVAAGPALAAGAVVEGAGSTWSQVAVDQWRADVKSRLGLKVNYTGTGSSTGRSLFVQGKVDFAISEIPFTSDEAATLKGGGRSFQYLPIVAGGTALMYNVKNVAGQQVRDLQLSPATIAGIFTGKITDWSDAKITADNGGTALPARKIVPVVRSDGSGTSAQFTAFLATETPSLYGPFASDNGRDPNTGTSDFPSVPGFVAQSGSDGIANYVANKTTGVGAIGYVETAYAIQRGYPVAAVKNKAGKYQLPTSENVSVALQKATLNADRTQKLKGVYENTAAKTYPISSYSYMITPTGGFNADKGFTLTQFMNYFACTGQKKASVLGYAPLPPNLVQIVFDAIQAIPGKDPAIPAKATASNCDNPTFSGSLGSGATGSIKGSTTKGTSTTPDPTASGTATDPATSTDTTTTTDASGGLTVGQPVTVRITQRGSGFAEPALILLAVMLAPPLLVVAWRSLAPATGRGVRRVRVALFGAESYERPDRRK